jgi:hypothetical protein
MNCSICQNSKSDELVKMCDHSHYCHKECYLNLEIMRCPEWKDHKCVTLYEIKEEIKDYKKEHNLEHESDQYAMDGDLGSLISFSDIDDVYYRVENGEIPDKDSVIQAICIDCEELSLYLIDRCPELDEECLGYAFVEGLTEVIKALLKKGFTFDTYCLYLLIRSGDMDPHKMQYLFRQGIAPDTHCLNNALFYVYENEQKLINRNQTLTPSLLTKYKNELIYWKQVVVICIDRGAFPNDILNPLSYHDYDFDTHYTTEEFLKVIKDKNIVDALKIHAFDFSIQKVNKLLDRVCALKPTVKRMEQWCKNLELVLDAGGEAPTKITINKFKKITPLLSNDMIVKFATYGEKSM